MCLQVVPKSKGFITCKVIRGLRNEQILSAVINKHLTKLLLNTSSLLIRIIFSVTRSFSQLVFRLPK